MNVTLREKQLRTGKKSLYLDYYEDGRRKYEYLKLYLTGDKQQDKQIMKIAKMIRNKREIQIKEEIFGLGSKFHLTQDFMDFFTKIKERKEYNQPKWRQAQNHLMKFLNGKNIVIGNVTPSFLEDFKTYLLVQVQSETARGLMACVNYTLKQAVKEDFIPTNPMDKIEKIKGKNTQKYFLTIEELEKVSNTYCPYPNIKRAFLFSCYTGLRKSDIKNLKWNAIHGDTLELTQKKTSEPLYIPLHATAIELLGNKGKAEAPVFDLPANSYLGAVIKTWIKAAGIDKPITFHSARHTFATMALTYGVDIYTVSKLLGHSRVEVTQVYAQIIDKKKQDSINLLPKINLEVEL